MSRQALFRGGAPETSDEPDFGEAGLVMDEEVFKAGQSPANFLWGPCVSDTGDPMVYFELASWSSGDARHDPAAAPPASRGVQPPG